MIDDGDTADVNDELNEAGLVGNDGTELIGMETTDCEGTDNVDGGKRNGGEWKGTELVEKETAGGGETSGGKEADNGGGGGYADNELSGKELSVVHAFTGGIIALGKAMLLVVVGTGTAGDKLGDWDESTLL